VLRRAGATTPLFAARVLSVPPVSPRVLTVDASRPDPAAIAEAARVLRAGGLVAFPTETVYGLGARALDPAAVAKVFAAKGRPSGHPLIAHVDGEDAARAIASSWSARASALARAFWPGPLTLVVPRSARVPDVVTGGGSSVAIRAPAHAVALALLRAVGEPLAAPSANRYQTLSPTLAAHVVKSLGDAVDLVLDGGPCSAGIESTVIDVDAEPPRVLRPGALELAKLRAIVPAVVYEGFAIAGEGTHASPGMDARHYAPRARVLRAPHRRGALDLAEAEARAQGTGGAKVGLVVRGEAPAPAPEGVVVRALADEPERYGRELFATLHALDDEGCVAVVIEDVPQGDAWWAVADRLRRAGA
jgi:L-threonylcarbamoyladenylate synthase